MSYRANIRIYRMRKELNIPLDTAPNNMAKCKLHDFVIVVNDEVWVTDRLPSDSNLEGEFAKPVFDKIFINMNPEIFEDITLGFGDTDG